MSRKSEIQKFERLAFLYYLGIQISHPYDEIVKSFDAFYNCHEKIEIDNPSSASNTKMFCGFDEEHNFLFALSNADYENRIIFYTEKHSNILKTLTVLLNTLGKSDRDARHILKYLNDIVAKRYGIEYEITSSSASSVFTERLTAEYLKVKNLKSQNLETLPFRATV